MRTLLLLVLLAPVPQEDLRIDNLLRRLDDDSIESRASAAKALIELGKPAIPALKRALAGAGVEMKDRLSDILRRIQDRERLAALMPPASRITIQAKNRPLREVFEKLTKQTGTAIDYSAVPDGAKVTVSLDRVPLWKAIEQVCRASGKVMAEIEQDHVVIAEEPYVALPGRITDLFSVTLERIELSSEVTFGMPERYEQFSSHFRVAWEKGTRPYRIQARIEELVDGEGNELVAQGEELEAAAEAVIGPDTIAQRIVLPSTRGPGPQATKIGKLRVEVELEFPLRFAEAKIDLAGGRMSGVAECAEFTGRLHKFDRAEGVISGVLVMIPKGVLEGEFRNESVVLRDKAGKEYAANVSETGQTSEGEVPYQINFHGVPQNAEITELVLRIPTEVHRERLDVEFKDLSLQ